MTADGGRHCSDESRKVPRIQGTHVTLCGCYTDDCPQISLRAEDDCIGVRKSSDPDTEVWFDPHEFQEFLDAVRDPNRDILQEARDAFEANGRTELTRLGTVVSE